jgi:hypothetical protein
MGDFVDASLRTGCKFREDEWGDERWAAAYACIDSLSTKIFSLGEYEKVMVL